MEEAPQKASKYRGGKPGPKNKSPEERLCLRQEKIEKAQRKAERAARREEKNTEQLPEVQPEKLKPFNDQKKEETRLEKEKRDRELAEKDRLERKERSERLKKEKEERDRKAIQKEQELKERSCKVISLSPRELFQQTLGARDFAQLGVSKVSLVAFMIYADILLTEGRTMDIAHLRHFECSSKEIEAEEIEGFFLSRRKFLEIIEEELDDERIKVVKKYISDQSVIEVTKQLLEISGLSILGMTDYIGMSSLAKKIELKDADLVCLGLTEKSKAYFDEKCIAITLVGAQFAEKCVRATSCVFLKRCRWFFRENLVGGLKNASCENCPQYPFDVERAKEESFVENVSFGIADYNGFYSIE